MKKDRKKLINFIGSEKKMRWEKRKAAERPPKPLKITCTEIQLKRARQLYYARSAGFNIGYADYIKEQRK